MTQAEMSPVDRQLFVAARGGNVNELTRLLDENPDGIGARDQPYEQTLLHAAAFAGHLQVVNLLLDRGLDPNTREKGDNTYPMHWASAAGHEEVVKRLADAGGDVVGHGDLHELEVIGWGTCWEGVDERHRRNADFLVSRGARHHIFSAISLELEEEVTRIIKADPGALERQMSRYENHQRPLHFAVRMNHPAMVSLLLDLGADAEGTDDAGNTAPVYATVRGADRNLLERETGGSPPSSLFTAVALGDWEAASKLIRDYSAGNDTSSLDAGVLHLMAKRKDLEAVTWLIEHGFDPNARWNNFGAILTPLHMAIWQGKPDIVRALLDAGADPTIRDSMHDGDAIGWAEYSKRPDLVAMLKAHVKD